MSDRDHLALQGWQIYEKALLAIGGLCFVALLGRAGIAAAATLEVGFASLAFALLLRALLFRKTAFLQRLRLLVAYLYTLWFFDAVRRIVPAFRRSLCDPSLLAIDRFLFGETPAALFTPGLGFTEVMSAAYLSYLVFLHTSLLRYGLSPFPKARLFWTYLFVTYAVGFSGYLLIPAVGPNAAYPSLFSTPLPFGWIGHLNEAIVSRGSAVYDVFPSLHVLITCVLLDAEYRFSRRLFWLLLPWAFLLVLSTVILRYHYAVDLLAGAALFVILRLWFSWWSRRYGAA